MTADLSPAERATVARFDAAPDADESLRSRVADALTAPLPRWRGGPDRAYWLARADAAIAVMRGEQ